MPDAHLVVRVDAVERLRSAACGPIGIDNGMSSESQNSVESRPRTRLARAVRWIDLDFVVLVVLAVVWNAATVCDANRSVVHDTFSDFIIFHAYHSHLAHEGGLPLWFPYVTFGFPALLYQTALSPSNCGFALVGSFLPLSDSNFLFKASILHETLVHLAGLYLCSQRLFLERSTRFLVCLLGVGTLSWIGQIHLNLRIVECTPWMLWCVLRWTDTGRSAWFWATGIVTCVALIGAPIYFASLHLLTLTCIAAPFVVRRPRMLQGLLRLDAWNLGAAVACGLVAAVLVTSTLVAIEGLDVAANGRRTDGSVDLPTFLHYASFDRESVVRHYLLGTVRFPIPEPNMYVGLATWFFCVAAAAGRRSLDWWAVSVPAVTLLLLSLSEEAAKLLYWFPYMDLFRHRMYVLSAANLFVVLWAGFGIERFATAQHRTSIRWLGWASLFLAVLLIAARFRWSDADSPSGLLRLGALVAIGGVATACRTTGFTRLPIGLLIFWSFLDVTLYQQSVNRVALSIPEAEKPLFRARPLGYVPFRTRTGFRFKHLYSMYSIQHQWERSDPGVDDGHALAVDPRLKVTVQSLWDTEALYRIGGYSRAKLIFTNIALLSDRWCEAEHILRVHEGRVAAVSSPDAPRTLVPSSEQVEFEVVPDEFTANQVRCRVDAPTDGWLLYSDAMFPGWIATLNGTPTDVVLANGCFKAVRVPAGRGEVTLRFGGRMRLWSHALFATAVAMFLAFTGLIAACFRRRDPAR